MFKIKFSFVKLILLASISLIYCLEDVTIDIQPQPYQNIDERSELSGGSSQSGGSQGDSRSGSQGLSSVFDQMFEIPQTIATDVFGPGPGHVVGTILDVPKSIVHTFLGGSGNSQSSSSFGSMLGRNGDVDQQIEVTNVESVPQSRPKRAAMRKALRAIENKLSPKHHESEHESEIQNTKRKVDSVPRMEDDKSEQKVKPEQFSETVSGTDRSMDSDTEWDSEHQFRSSDLLGMLGGQPTESQHAIAQDPAKAVDAIGTGRSMDHPHHMGHFRQSGSTSGSEGNSQSSSHNPLQQMFQIPIKVAEAAASVPMNIMKEFLGREEENQAKAKLNQALHRNMGAQRGLDVATLAQLLNAGARQGGQQNGGLSGLAQLLSGGRGGQSGQSGQQSGQQGEKNPIEQFFNLPLEIAQSFMNIPANIMKGKADELKAAESEQNAGVKPEEHQNLMEQLMRMREMMEHSDESQDAMVQPSYRAYKPYPGGTTGNDDKMRKSSLKEKSSSRITTNSFNNKTFNQSPGAFIEIVRAIVEYVLGPGPANLVANILSLPENVANEIAGPNAYRQGANKLLNGQTLMELPKQLIQNTLGAFPGALFDGMMSLPTFLGRNDALYGTNYMNQVDPLNYVMAKRSAPELSPEGQEPKSGLHRKREMYYQPQQQMQMEMNYDDADDLYRRKKLGLLKPLTLALAAPPPMLAPPPPPLLARPAPLNPYLG